MAYSFEQRESVGDGLRRVAREQLEKAIGELTDGDLGLYETVYQVRKRCKKLRGLLRLAPPQFDATYDSENAWYRNAARKLSHLRDAKAIVTFDDLLSDHQDEVDPQAYGSIRDRLADRRRNTTRDGVEGRLNNVLAAIQEGKRRVDGWSVDAKGFAASQSLSHGLQDARIARRPQGGGMDARAVGAGAPPMPTSLHSAVQLYLRSRNPARATRGEYYTTLRKWREWGGGVCIEQLCRRQIREFLDWVFERAVAQNGTNPGRTTNRARAHLRAVISWAWEHDLIEQPPRFPKAKPQRSVAGRHYLTKAEINALYFATHQMRRLRGWDLPIPVGRFWRAALVVFFNYGLDSGTVWRSTARHEPILWRHVSWNGEAPNRAVKQQSRWGWLYYRRVKTKKTFWRPMNRVVHAHIKSVLSANPDPDEPVFVGGGAQPNRRF